MTMLSLKVVPELCNKCIGEGYSQSKSDDCTECSHRSKAVICPECGETYSFGEVVDNCSYECDCEFPEIQSFWEDHFGDMGHPAG